jgi:dihydrolipoamide dehydrogenase
MKHLDVAIIGAGTSGLTARRQVEKRTDNYLVFDDGPLGTTCARVGCMPSKVLIQVAEDFHRRKSFEQEGIKGGEKLEIDTKTAMKHVRSLRDRFVRAVVNPMDGWEDKLVRARAVITGKNTLRAGDQEYTFDKLIIGAGSKPIIPGPFRDYSKYLVTTDEFFEMDDLPKSMAVFGLGVIGVELGQALSRLGVEVTGYTIGKGLGALSDPEIQEYTAKKMSEEFKIYFNGGKLVGEKDGKVQIEADGEVVEVERVLMSVGRAPTVNGLGLENLGIELSERGMPTVDPNTMQIQGAEHVFMPGDINGERPILHEAADEGYIAGYNSGSEIQCFKRRVPLGVTFSDPNIASAGLKYSDLKDSGRDFVTGKVSFEGQGRSIVKLKEKGMLHVYADKKTGEILGAEMFGPDTEHIAHLLAWSIATKLSVFEALRMPFYHPVIEEGLRTAIRGAASQVEGSEKSGELARCQDPPIR